MYGVCQALKTVNNQVYRPGQDCAEKLKYRYAAFNNLVNRYKKRQPKKTVCLGRMEASYTAYTHLNQKIIDFNNYKHHQTINVSFNLPLTSKRIGCIWHSGLSNTPNTTWSEMHDLICII